MTVGISPKRAKPRWLALIVVVAICTLTLGAVVQAQIPPSTFEGGDGNLVADGQGNIDWNTFASDSGLAGAAQFTIATDDTGNKDGSIFVANTKNHHVVCPKVGSGSMGGGGNKDDLARMYLATQTIDNKVFLYMAWVRVYPQNSLTAAANISFEFNQSNTKCRDAGFTGDQASDLKIRTPGDMLVLYDFTGGSTAQGSGNPAIRISRWLGASSPGSCEVSNQTKPCWGTLTTDLTNPPSGTPAAEARVNATESVFDAHAGENIGHVAFGEASINLSDPLVNVFPASGTPTSCVSFGSAAGISRSSGNSISSSLSDLVGPVGFTLSNCGRVIINKVTSPTGDTTTSFSYAATDITRLTPGSTSTTIPNRIGEGQVLDWNNVAPGTGLTISEGDPGPLYALTNISCTGGSNVATNTTNATVSGVPARSVKFDLAAGDTVTCTFTNTRQKLESRMDTDPWVYPNDKAVVKANAASTTITGDVTFKLYNSEVNCEGNGATGLLYIQEVALPGGTATEKTVNTSNPGGGQAPGPASYKIESDAKVYWRVQYSGDTNHLGRLSDCVEFIDVDLNSHTNGTNVP